MYTPPLLLHPSFLTLSYLLYKSTSVTNSKYPNLNTIFQPKRFFLSSFSFFLKSSYNK